MGKTPCSRCLADRGTSNTASTQASSGISTAACPMWTRPGRWDSSVSASRHSSRVTAASYAESALKGDRPVSPSHACSTGSRARRARRGRNTVLCESRHTGRRPFGSPMSSWTLAPLIFPSLSSAALPFADSQDRANRRGGHVVDIPQGGTMEVQATALAAATTSQNCASAVRPWLRVRT